MQKTVDEILKEQVIAKKSLKIAVRVVWDELGEIDLAVAKEIARCTGAGLGRIFEIQSKFQKNSERILIQYCGCPMCRTNEQADVLYNLETLLRYDDDGVSDCGKYEVREDACLGRCENGPVLVINGNRFENVLAGELDEILKESTIQ